MLVLVRPSFSFIFCLLCVGVQINDAARRKGPETSVPEGFRVFSDVDDTLWCSQGFPAGADQSCYKHEFYPGAMQFMLELARGPNESQVPPKFILLSARPRKLAMLFDAIKISENNPLAQVAQSVGRANGFPAWGIDIDNAQYGRTRDFFLPQAVGIGMNSTKTSNWLAFKTKRSTVFVGDNGQGDQSAAQMMSSEGCSNPRLKRSFIHNVLATSPKPGCPSVTLFDTYHDAAVTALEHGLIAQAGYERVREAILRSSVMQLCLHAHLFTENRYPCVEDSGAVVDWLKRTPVENVTVNLADNTVLLPNCRELYVSAPDLSWTTRVARWTKAVLTMDVKKTPLIDANNEGMESRCSKLLRIAEPGRGN